jgi:hypothetical protein
MGNFRPASAGRSFEETMPRQNRPIVRDGRLQVQKKRTDRRYLRPAAPADPAESDAETVDEAAAAEEPAPAPVSAASSVQRMPAAVRAIQHQGTRRRGVDVPALLRADTEYAVHELRRIFILAVMVVATLVVLTIVLR